MKKAAAAIYLAVTITPLIIMYFLKNRNKKQRANELQMDEDREFYHHTLFSSIAQNFNCKPHIQNHQPCGPCCSRNQIDRTVRFISAAQSTISLCVYAITLRDVATELISAHKRGVTVRVITDKVLDYSTASKVHALQSYGIEARMQEAPDSLMHHKFCLIDENVKASAKMFFGSLNLTMQAYVCNFEDVILTNNSNIISRFSEEFEYLWNEFK